MKSFPTKYGAFAGVTLGMSMLLLSGCSASEEFGKAQAQLVTVEQSEALASFRLNNYERGIVGFEMSVPQQGQNMWLTGRVDLTEHRGYANMTTQGSPDSYALITWTEAQVAAIPTADTRMPVQPPDHSAWQARALTPKDSPFDMALSFILQLAADRPENPLLVRQNGAQFHGYEEINGQRTAVYTGPGADQQPSDKIHYFVDDSGMLVKTTVRVPSLQEPVVITFKESEKTEIQLPKIGQ